MNSLSPIASLYENAGQNPNKIAFWSTDVKVTYAQAAGQIGRFASLLGRRGVQASQLVLTFLPPRLDWYVTLALHSIGATSCSGTARPPANLDFEWVVTTKLVPDWPSNRQILVNDLFIKEVGRAEPAAPNYSEDPESLVRLVLTSGTTGQPKAVPISLGLMKRRFSSQSRWASQQGVKSMTLMGIASAGGGSRIFYSALGGTFFATPPSRFDWKGWLALIDAIRPSELTGSPVQLEHLFAAAKHQRKRLDFLDNIRSAGTVFPQVLAERISTLTNAKITSVYGSTEAGVVAKKEVLLASDPFDLGTIDPEVQVSIVDESGNEMDPGQTGHIRVKTPTMVDSYFLNPQTSSAYFKAGWFYPGDEGYLNTENRLFLAGRTSEFVNAGGVKIDPAIVDQEVLRLSNVQDGAAFGWTSPSGNVRLAIAVVAMDGFVASTAMQTLKAKLGGKCPAMVFEVESIPRNEMGKALRVQLSDRLQDSTASAEI